MSNEQNTKDHSAILRELECLSAKLDKAMEQKADKLEVKTLNNRLWAIIVSFAAAFIGVISYMINSHFN